MPSAHYAPCSSVVRCHQCSPRLSGGHASQRHRLPRSGQTDKNRRSAAGTYQAFERTDSRDDAIMVQDVLVHVNLQAHVEKGPATAFRQACCCSKGFLKQPQGVRRIARCFATHPAKRLQQPT